MVDLDGHVRQGDSLLDPIALARTLGVSRSPVAERTERIAAARQRLFSGVGAAKRTAAADLAREESALAGEWYAAAVTGLERRIARLVADARQLDLFGRRAGFSPESRRELRRLRQCRRELRSAQRRLRREGGAPFFAFESHFADVAPQGFDLVLGNPPWIRGERLPARVREALVARYQTWKPMATRGYAHLPDLAVAFVERGLELTAPGGAAALLVPAKLATSGYGELLRRSLATTTSIARAAAVGGAFRMASLPKIFSSVSRSAAIEAEAEVAVAMRTAASSERR